MSYQNNRTNQDVANLDEREIKNSSFNLQSDLSPSRSISFHRITGSQNNIPSPNRNTNSPIRFPSLDRPQNNIPGSNRNTNSPISFQSIAGPETSGITEREADNANRINTAATVNTNSNTELGNRAEHVSIPEGNRAENVSIPEFARDSQHIHSERIDRNWHQVNQPSHFSLLDTLDFITCQRLRLSYLPPNRRDFNSLIAIQKFFANRSHNTPLWYQNLSPENLNEILQIIALADLKYKKEKPLLIQQVSYMLNNGSLYTKALLYEFFIKKVALNRAALSSQNTQNAQYTSRFAGYLTMSDLADIAVQVDEFYRGLSSGLDKNQTQILEEFALYYQAVASILYSRNRPGFIIDSLNKLLHYQQARSIRPLLGQMKIAMQRPDGRPYLVKLGTECNPKHSNKQQLKHYYLNLFLGREDDNYLDRPASEVVRRGHTRTY